MSIKAHVEFKETSGEGCFNEDGEMIYSTIFKLLSSPTLLRSERKLLKKINWEMKSESVSYNKSDF